MRSSIARAVVLATSSAASIGYSYFRISAQPSSLIAPSCFIMDAARGK